MNIHDVLVVGGGAAGLSAAVTLARSLRTVQVIDAGEPRNAPAHAAHNLLGREGISPLDLLAAGRSEARSYGAEITTERAESVQRTSDGFMVDLASGAQVVGRQLLLATGLVDELPDVAGVRELWGERVLHCPYCHGYEVRGQRIGVLGTTGMVSHQALLFGQLSQHVTVLLHDLPGLDAEEEAMLRGAGVDVREGHVERLVLLADGVRAHLRGGGSMDLDAIAVQTRMVARSDLYEQLGGVTTEHPMGRFIGADPLGRTSLEGVWAAGNVSDLSAMISVAGGQGTMAGAAINAELARGDARSAAGL